MTDKVQKIREEVVRMHNLLPVMDGDNISVNYADRICTTLEMYIDSLQEDPVSEELEEKAAQLSQKYFPNEENIWARVNIEAQNCKNACIEMAKWQKEKMMANVVDAEIYREIEDDDTREYSLHVISHKLDKSKYKFMEKVKVIIIKED